MYKNVLLAQLFVVKLKYKLNRLEPCMLGVTWRFCFKSLKTTSVGTSCLHNILKVWQHTYSESDYGNIKFKKC